MAVSVDREAEPGVSFWLAGRIATIILATAVSACMGSPKSSNKTMCQIKLAPDGHLIYAKTLVSSGNADIDQLALSDLSRAHWPPFQGKAPRIYDVPVEIVTPNE